MNKQDKQQLAAIIIRDCKTPGEFIQKYLNCLGLTKSDLARKMGTTQSYIQMVCSDYNRLGREGCVKIAAALEFNPKLLYRLASEYNMDTYLKEQGFEEFADEMFESKEIKGILKYLLKIMHLSWNAGRNSLNNKSNKV